MNTNELILKQIQYLRYCLDLSAEANTEYATAKNAYDIADSAAGSRVISSAPVFDDLGEPLKLSNDEARKAYRKDQTIIQANELTKAKEDKDTAASRVEVEISVLSALKLIAKDEKIDDDILARYDILGEKEAGI